MIVLAALLFLSACWLLAQVAIGALLGEHPTAVQLGVGPGLRVWKQGRVEVRLGLIPGGFVQYPPERMTALTFPRHAALHLLPWLSLGALGLLAGAGLGDFARGLSLPLRIFEVLAHWPAWDAALRATPLEALPRLAARVVVVNLLPVGGLSGGVVIARALPERGRPWFLAGSVAALIAALVFGLVRSGGG